MARNADFMLTMGQAAIAAANADTLATLPMGTVITVSFTKRNGEARVISGPFADMVGRVGTSSHGVTVDTEAGPRTANLWAIDSLTVA